MISKRELVGHRIASVELLDDKTVLVIRLMGGPIKAYTAVGECCSYSWIEHLEVPIDITGATILDIDEVHMDGTNDDTENPVCEHGRREHECLSLYQTIIKTDRGEVSVEYRNSSNGYYGGWLEPCGVPA